MTTINRTAILVKPGQAFLDWLHQADPTSEHLTLAELQDEPTIYLIPECDSREDARTLMEILSPQIFEEQLQGWYRVPLLWPHDRDLAAFNRWFEWTDHSMVIDLSGGPLLQEED